MIPYQAPALDGNTIDLGDRECRLLLHLRQPRIAVVEGFLDDAEIAALLTAAEPRLQPATVFRLSDGERVQSAYRTGSHIKLEYAESPLVCAIEARTAQLAGCTDVQGERLEVVCYEVGQLYRPHQDWFNPSTAGGLARIQERGQRIATVVMYLNDVSAGGATVFTQLGLTIPARRGCALFFSNIDEQGEPDPRVQHSGAPVEAGHKFIVTRWFNDQPQPRSESIDG